MDWNNVHACLAGIQIIVSAEFGGRLFELMRMRGCSTTVVSNEIHQIIIFYPGLSAVLMDVPVRVLNVRNLKSSRTQYQFKICIYF